MFGLVGAFGLVAGLAAVVGVSHSAYAQGGPIETFTSAQYDVNGPAPQFVEPGPWQITWTFTCHNGPGLFDTQLGFWVNTPNDAAGFGAVVAAAGPGTETFGGIYQSQSDLTNSAGTFTMSAIGNCPWIFTVSPRFFNARPGAARQIGAGANGAVWAIGTYATGAAGYAIYHWTGSNWAGVPGAGVTVAVAPNGSPWVTNATHHIYRRVGSAWVLTPGSATDLAIGANGAVWAVGTNPTGPGNEIYHWTGSGWVGAGGSAVAVAVDQNGNPWIINATHHIYRRVGNAWSLMPGAATALAIGANSAVWVAGTYTTGAGYGVYHWTGSGWAAVGGAAVAIAVDQNGNPWIVDSLNHIYFG
jgi:hypothetical protein